MSWLVWVAVFFFFGIFMFRHRVMQWWCRNGSSGVVVGNRTKHFVPTGTHNGLRYARTLMAKRWYESRGGETEDTHENNSSRTLSVLQSYVDSFREQEISERRQMLNDTCPA
eukprot:PhF_6_TR2693/c0_g1_i1/m.4434